MREGELWAHLAAVIESSDDAIISKTLQGVIQTWNSGARRMFGYEAQEVIGKPITILIPQDRQGEEPEILDRLKRGDRVDHFETVRIRRDGTPIDISLSISPIKNAAGKIVGASKIARDITIRKKFERAQQALLEVERNARSEAERMSHVKDTFLATLSHELRTPINAIIGWSHILRQRPHNDAEVTEAIEVIERNARVQTQLIEDLLDVSRIISGKLRLDVQHVDLQDVVKAAVATVRHAAESKDIRLQVIVDPLAGAVRGDPARLQQCFWNVLSNAIKFTPKGGKVQVGLERVNSHVEFSVTDTGIGVQAEFLPHIFERFSQADSSTTRRYGGLGLGLSIVKHIAELHGGRVRAASGGEGCGTTITIELPLLVFQTGWNQGAREHPRSSSRSPVLTDLPSLAGVTVLAVDDEPDARELLKRVLEACGATVVLAASATDALASIAAAKPDMIVSDIGMPGIDGYDFIARVRALRAEEGGRTPAAALTAFARAEDRTRALRAGYQTHVAKPVEPGELAAVVASLAVRK